MHSIPAWDRIVKIKVPIQEFKSGEADYATVKTRSEFQGSGGKRIFQRNLMFSTLQEVTATDKTPKILKKLDENVHLVC